MINNGGKLAKGATVVGIPLGGALFLNRLADNPHYSGALAAHYQGDYGEYERHTEALSVDVSIDINNVGPYAAWQATQ